MTVRGRPRCRRPGTGRAGREAVPFARPSCSPNGVFPFPGRATAGALARQVRCRRRDVARRVPMCWNGGPRAARSRPAGPVPSLWCGRSAGADWEHRRSGAADRQTGRSAGRLTGDVSRTDAAGRRGAHRCRAPTALARVGGETPRKRADLMTGLGGRAHGPARAARRHCRAAAPPEPAADPDIRGRRLFHAPAGHGDRRTLSRRVRGAAGLQPAPPHPARPRRRAAGAAPSRRLRPALLCRLWPAPLRWLRPLFCAGSVPLLCWFRACSLCWLWGSQTPSCTAEHGRRHPPHGAGGLQGDAR
ncbi:hypothetical protein HD596_002037 [Nonomuraea jabiensis]|uniref:Uncharacterized protein n=1 Tax=Nonomuraea jabiensis TaxID=882448 RepID=A0A7W9G193_9ACTN|nr:hypothetical protein [Nonomuraea jabiensis]